MWLFWAFLSAIGSSIWYLAPKFFSTQNVFSVIFWGGLLAMVTGLLFSKTFYNEWVDLESIKLGFSYAIGGFILSTIALTLAINSGGKIGIVSVVIELSVILAFLFSVFYFKEYFNWIQIIGIFLAITGICLVLYFEKS